MDQAETRERVRELVRQIQEKSVQLSDLEIILDDYERERRELLHEIGQLKASLWELVGDREGPVEQRKRPLRSLDEISD